MSDCYTPYFKTIISCQYCTLTGFYENIKTTFFPSKSIRSLYQRKPTQAKTYNFKRNLICLMYLKLKLANDEEKKK